MYLQKIRIAVLLTSHNRVSKTRACLNLVCSQRLPDPFFVEFFLVDDASSDGTPQVIKTVFPEVRVIAGDGSLYWNGGMRLAFAAAVKEDYDYYLWLNDDTMLYPDALRRLVNTHKAILSRGRRDGIVVGSLRDADNGRHTYGCLVRSLSWSPLKFKPLQPTEEVQKCHTLNGNCVLIPRIIASEIGNLDPAFTHHMADYDYGLRVRKKGYAVWLAPGYLGTCKRNGGKAPWLDETLGCLERMKALVHAKCWPPREWLIYTRRYGGPLWPIFWVGRYVKPFLTGFSQNRKK